MIEVAVWDGRGSSPEDFGKLDGLPFGFGVEEEFFWIGGEGDPGYPEPAGDGMAVYHRRVALFLHSSQRLRSNS